MADEHESRSPLPRKAILEVRPKEPDVVEVVDRNVGRAIGVLE
jgi:hypothetical protein